MCAIVFVSSLRNRYMWLKVFSYRVGPHTYLSGCYNQRVVHVEDKDPHVFVITSFVARCTVFSISPILLKETHTLSHNFAVRYYIPWIKHSNNADDISIIVTNKYLRIFKTKLFFRYKFFLIFEISILQKIYTL